MSAPIVLPRWDQVPELSDPAASFLYLEQVAAYLGNLLLPRGLTLTTAESCTGGLISGMVTAVSGSSHWFERGFVTYTNNAKMELLGVRASTLERYGAVSEFTALQMSGGALEHSRAALAVSVTGIAGPTGGTPNKPVGTVCMGLACHAPRCQWVTTHAFRGERNAVRAQTVYEALRGLCLLVQNLIDPHELGALQVCDADWNVLRAAGYHPQPRA